MTPFPASAIPQDELSPTRTVASAPSHAMMAAVAQFSFDSPGRNRASWPTTSGSSSTIWPRRSPREQRVYSGECHPALDVLETDDGSRSRSWMSPACPPQALRVLFRRRYAGRSPAKRRPRPPAAEPTFHLVEREFGRFARAVRLTGAFDVQRAQRDARRRRADDRAAEARRAPRPARTRIPRHHPRRPRMKILFIGDIVGRPGRELMRKGLRAPRRAPRRRTS